MDGAVENKKRLAPLWDSEIVMGKVIGEARACPVSAVMLSSTHIFR
jgi:hypothetical protein